MRLNNPNIITRKGCSAKPIIFKDVPNLHCIWCKEEFPFNTKKRFYLLNSHGWGFCVKCIKIAY